VGPRVSIPKEKAGRVGKGRWADRRTFAWGVLEGMESRGVYLTLGGALRLGYGHLGVQACWR
jgi:hypothetical protein